MFAYPITFISALLLISLGISIVIYSAKDDSDFQKENDTIFVNQNKTHSFILENKPYKTQCRNMTDNICHLNYQTEPSTNQPSNLNCAADKIESQRNRNKCAAALILFLALLNY